MTDTPKAECFDCGRPYGNEHGFPDFVLPNKVWAQISPTGDENGMLCPSCICGRLHRAGIETTGRFRSGPLVEDPRHARSPEGQVMDLTEKVARALCAADPHLKQWDEFGDTIPGTSVEVVSPEVGRNWWRNLATAALAACRPAIRDEALEEAAVTADSACRFSTMWDDLAVAERAGHRAAAAAIRAMKGEA